MRINNVNVYGLKESIVASGYPMYTNDFYNYENEFKPENFEKHLNRAKKLANNQSNSGHCTFLSGIIVQFDLSFPLKAWSELQRYHFIDFVSSQSTMHRISKFNIEDKCNDFVDEEIIQIVDKLAKNYNENPSQENYLKLLYNCPSGLHLTARLSTNYLQLKTLYPQRHNHRLPCWREFCNWIETLPYAEDFIL